ncbi:MAG: SDR family NAD(P)-dependent oxidoreductase [Ardenticatenaceae bacterium]|nr:SDR family NAD(P)-dependent oxidoreductase [Ardenticatenaceae bacterium]HBY93282.1 hypothetical protein [Chloroflexota bacterium]
MPEQRLAGKVAIITGAASGIGRATAILFAQHGASVVVNTDRRVDWAEETVRQVREVGGEAIFVQGDVAVGADVEGLVGAAERHFGRLDILVTLRTRSKRGGFSGNAWANAFRYRLKAPSEPKRCTVKTLPVLCSGSFAAATGERIR